MTKLHESPSPRIQQVQEIQVSSRLIQLKYIDSIICIPRFLHQSNALLVDGCREQQPQYPQNRRGRGTRLAFPHLLQNHPGTNVLLLCIKELSDEISHFVKTHRYKKQASNYEHSARQVQGNISRTIPISFGPFGCELPSANHL